MAYAEVAARLHAGVREVRGRDDRRPIVGQRGTMRVGTMPLGMLPRTTHGTWRWRVTRHHVATELTQRTGTSTLSIIFASCKSGWREGTLRRLVGKNVGSRVSFAAGVDDHLAEPIDMHEHGTETVRGAIKFTPITLTVEELHGMLDGKNLVKELRDCLTEPQAFRSPWGCCCHNSHVGTKAKLFKAFYARNPAGLALQHRARSLIIAPRGPSSDTRITRNMGTNADANACEERAR
jgi:hypothetical protein